jgi:hypothetical protein
VRKATIVADDGTVVGWLLGHAVTEDGWLVSDTIRLPGAPDWNTGCERLVDELAGRFLLLLVSSPSPRVYPDALGMLGAVYAPSSETVASTSNLIPLGPSTPFNVPRIRAVDAPYNTSMYPLGLTPRDGIERVLPNHFLDLSTWTLVRRWPTEPLRSDADPAAVQVSVAASTARTIAALAREYPLQSPLTAGRDSRALLACAKDVLDRVTLFTAELPREATGWRDVTVARRIAREMGVEHTLLRHRRARPGDLREWAIRTAGEVGEARGWRATRTYRQVDRDRFLLSGWAGDIARPIYWEKVTSDERITAQHVLRVCELGPYPEFVDRANRWLDALPTDDAATVLDLVFAEQRGGCWAGVIRYAHEGTSPGNVAPMCHQQTVRSMMSLPVDYRRLMRFERDLIEKVWPELLEFPFNEELEVPRARRRFYAVADVSRRAAGASRLARRDPGRVARALGRRIKARAGIGR